MKDMEARITANTKRTVGVYVSECLQAKAVVDKVLTYVIECEGGCSKGKGTTDVVRTKSGVKPLAAGTLPADEGSSDDEALDDSVSGGSVGEESEKSVSHCEGGSQQHSSHSKVSGDSDGSVASSDNATVPPSKEINQTPTKQRVRLMVLLRQLVMQMCPPPRTQLNLRIRMG